MIFASKSLDEVCDITSSKRIYASEYKQSGIPFYRGREIIERQKGKLKLRAELFITEDKYEQIKQRFGAPKAGDLLLTSVGTLGVPYVVKKSDKFYFKDGNLTWFRDFKGLNSEYLYYWILSPSGKAELKKATIGSSQSALTIVLLKRLNIALPREEDQQRIASRLRAYDDLIENNLKRITILEDMAKLLYRKYFDHPASSHYPKIPFLDCIELNPKVKIPKEGIKPFVPMGSLPENSMLISSFEERSGNSGSKFEIGDTLFARITPCLENGKTAFVHHLPQGHSAGFGSTEYIVMRSKSLCPEIVYLIARSDEIRKIAIKSMTGASGRQRVQEKCFASIELPQLPASTINSLASKLIPIFNQINVLNDKNNVLARTRQLLIPRLMSEEVNI